MPTLDISALNNTKTFTDYANQAATQKAALDAAALDAASKGNIYATQVLSAATATGNQGIYDQAKQHLAQNGIDLTGWAPDVQTATQQAQAARLAQSPIGSLFNAATKMDTNANTAQIAGGTVPDAGGNAIVNSLLKTGSLTGGIPVSLGAPASAPTVQPAQQSIAPVSNAPPPPSSNFTQALQNGGAQVLNDMGGLPTSQQPTMPLAQLSASPAGFQPPAKNPSETISAYNDRVNQAFNAWKEDPTNIANKAQAEAVGKGKFDAVKQDLSSSATYDQVNQTMDAIKQLINKGNLPTQSYLIPAAAKAFINQNAGILGDQNVANDYKSFGTLNEAQTIGAIKELASTGQIRMTRTLENIINRGYLVDPNATDAEKMNQANIVQTELRNAAVASHNINTQMNGGQPAQMTSPLTAPPSTVMGTPAQPIQATPQLMQQAKKAPDGNWYVPDPNRPGKFLQVGQ